MKLERVNALAAGMVATSLGFTWALVLFDQSIFLVMPASLAACAFTFQATWGVCILDERRRKDTEHDQEGDNG